MRRWLPVGLGILLGGWVVTGLVVGIIRDQGWQLVASRGEIDGPRLVRKHRVFLVPSDHGVLALSALNPHAAFEGEPVFFCPTGYFVGPHGETFDSAGRYIAGPAPRGMDRFPVRVRGTLVEVKLDEPIPGPPRTRSGSLPTGRQCGEPFVEGGPGILHPP